jgi:uncharacterized membrane protein
VTLIGVLIASAVVAYAAGGKADFSLGTSPSSQTVTAGQAATYSVSITRSNGFAGAVTLSVAGLPSGTTAAWKLADGTVTNVVPASQNTASLVLQTAATTPAATTTPVITAVSGNLSHTASVTLVVQGAAQPSFTLAATPATQTVVQTDSTSYALSITRSGGFSGALALSISGLPNGASATFSPNPVTGSTTTVTIDTAGNASAGAYTLTINGSATIAGSTVVRSATVGLTIQKNQGFGISGGLDSAHMVYPGSQQPINLTLSNPGNQDLRITAISVSVEQSTSKSGCSGSANFQVLQIPAGAYPLVLPANTTRTLSQLGLTAASQPILKMLDLGNQDACKGASLTLDYSGTATK